MTHTHTHTDCQCASVLFFIHSSEFALQQALNSGEFSLSLPRVCLFFVIDQKGLISFISQSLCSLTLITPSLGEAQNGHGLHLFFLQAYLINTRM